MIEVLPFVATLLLLPAEQADVRCVAVIGIASRFDTSLKVPGAEYAARVGAAIMERAQASREAVGDVILAEGMKVAIKPLDPAERQRCTERMAAVLVD